MRKLFTDNSLLVVENWQALRLLGITGYSARERMNRQSVPTQEPAHEISPVQTDRVTGLDKRFK